MRHTIKVKHSSIVISNYIMGECIDLERLLSLWDTVYFKARTLGFEYKEDTKELIVPRGMDLNLLSTRFGIQCDFDLKHDSFDPAIFRLLTEPKNDIQRKSISFLLGEGKFNFSKKYSQLALDLDTGDGKTYCVIAAMTFLRMKSLIITPNDGIKAQWLNSLMNMTDISEKFIIDLDGSATMKKLLTMKNIPYKVFLLNHRSTQSFAKKYGWEAVTELFQKLKIGLKVYDEAHLEFGTLMKTDFYTNTKKTIYLTANLERSDFQENKIFAVAFKNIPKFGKETRNDKRKHIIYIAVTYNSKPDIVEQGSVMGRHGFDRNKYIDYQIKTPKFFEAISYILDFVADKEGKVLILLSKNDAIDKLYEYLTKHYDKNIAIYNSTVAPEDKVKALEADIILSTPKSLGTGSDIPGLRFNIMTEQYSSSIIANQTSGRLRVYGDENSIHFEVIDKGFPNVDRLFKKRLKVFKEKCKDVVILEKWDVRN